jgi:hypothetical protein
VAFGFVVLDYIRHIPHLTRHLAHHRYTQTKRCDCIHSQLLTKLARVIEEKQLSATKLFDLHMPEELASDGRMPEQLVDWVQTGTLRIATVDDEDVQCDSLDAVRSLMRPSNR